MDEQLREALQQVFTADAKGCCGAGRHLVVKNEDGDFKYVHDSAQERIGIDESHVLLSIPCSREDAWDAVTEQIVTNAEIAELYGPVTTESGFVCDDDRKRICEDWAENMLDTLTDDELCQRLGAHCLKD